MMLAAIALALLVVMALTVARALLGPTIYDRILAVNAFGSKTVVLIAIIAAMAGRGDYLDIALVYAMMNFIAMIAVLKHFKYGSLGSAGRRPTDPQEE